MPHVSKTEPSFFQKNLHVTGSRFHGNQGSLRRRVFQGSLDTSSRAACFAFPSAHRCSLTKNMSVFCEGAARLSAHGTMSGKSGPTSPLTRTPPPGVPLEVHQRLCGGLLGDGSLEFRRHPKTDRVVSVRYREKHAAGQADLVFNQQQGLRPLTDKIKTPAVQEDKKSYSFLEVRTSRTPLLKLYGEAFYTSEKRDGRWRNKKQVPDTIGELLDNPLSLGVWVAGDGNPHGSAFSLCTQGFSEAENEVLKDVLQQNYRVKARVVLHSNGVAYYPHLYFPREEASKLIAQCDPQFRDLPSVKHKFLFV